MRRALGKGLAQLVGEQASGAPTELTLSSVAPNPTQPRRHFDEDQLKELAASIREVGVLQPILVRPVREGRYQIVAGERRYRAAQVAGLTHIPAIVRSATDQASLELALIENVQREDISAAECARAYQRLADEFGLTQEEIAARVGKSRASIANTMRLVRLPEEALEALDVGAVTEGQVRPLLSLPTREMQLRALERILVEGLTARQVEALVKRMLEPAPTPQPRVIDPNWRALEDGLSQHIGTPVRLSRGERGGRMVIEFASDDELQRVLDAMGFSL